MSSFRPARGLTVLTLTAVTAFIGLGVWQLDRLSRSNQRLAKQSALSTGPAASLAEVSQDVTTASFRRVDARGRFELADTILVGPVERGHQLGARVLTPLRIEGAAQDAPRLLVARGWVPQDAMERFLPPESGESDTVDVRGVALILALPRPEEMPLAGSRATRRTHFPRFTPDRPAIVAKLAEQLPYRLEPLMLQSIEPEPGGLPIGEVPRPTSFVDHRGYAIQWFCIAALSLVAWIEYGRRRARELAAE